MKQTAMQQHIEWLKATIEIAEEQYPILVNTLKLCLNDATQRLEMEKEQIIDAFSEGTRMIDVNDEMSAMLNGFIYYGENYEQDKQG